MDETTSKLAMFLVIFWTGLLILGGVFGKSLLLNQADVYSSSDSPFQDNVYQNENSRGNLIVKIMSFQVTDQVPIALSLFLNAIVIFSVYVLYMILHPLK